MPDGGYDEFIKEYGLKYKWEKKVILSLIKLPYCLHELRREYGRMVLRSSDVDCLFKWINTKGRCIAKNDYYHELVEVLIQAEKESVTDSITGIKNYISQSSIANNLNAILIERTTNPNPEQ
ncbi:hypothetical protein RhiirA5_408412 [Rhizophagus irregularis]|uniref:Uncharacterized protein n=1 Tax=Rhizophagus irregularis TaxID=588596 RepID=A0A2I1EJR7_9GLOM|nr:hypothetical protein RhiirA5_408412 [Rhizophagus irregularis]PKC73090.1 hypothetical protein RhiirA1_451564 [Rhizophagus irregularis]PKY22368.1 hypothetical protein RhiirB3_436302 [Rhizophagus irregularis]GET63991.1 hypothetical protein GLOIN_2v1786104 [Rhizophagus irregularis DAOM 181602=DAOM 197198]